MIMIVMIMFFILRIVAMNWVFWIHLWYFFLSRNRSFGFLQIFRLHRLLRDLLIKYPDWEKLGLQVLSEVWGEVEVGTVGAAVQGEALGAGVVEVSLDTVLPGLGHGLHAGLGLLAPSGAARPATDIAIVTVAAVAAIEAVSKGVA